MFSNFAACIATKWKGLSKIQQLTPRVWREVAEFQFSKIHSMLYLLGYKCNAMRIYNVYRMLEDHVEDFLHRKRISKAVFIERAA